jgi:peptidylprolyl isomerase
MKRIALLFALAGTVVTAQTTTPSTTPAKPATTTAKPAVTKSVTPASATAKTGTTAAKPAVSTGIKLPPGIPVYHKLLKTAFALRYQDIVIGTGPVAEPLKLYKVKYTGWLAADGKKFDSSDDHPGKEPIQFPQGRGRVIPGWDQGFEGMKIGGKRRLFIPYQLAYGAAGRPPVIPAKSDLIFDVELVDIAEMPAPGTPGAQGGRPMPPRPGTPGTPGTPGAPGVKPAAPPTPPTGTTPAPATTPAAPAPTPAPQPAAAPTTPQPADKPADKPANPAQPQ